MKIKKEEKTYNFGLYDYLPQKMFIIYFKTNLSFPSINYEYIDRRMRKPSTYTSWRLNNKTQYM